MKQTLLFFAFVSALSVGLVSCTASNPSGGPANVQDEQSGETGASGMMLSQADASNMTQLFSDSAQSDVQNATALWGVRAGLGFGLGQIGQFGFGFGGMMWMPNALSCVTVTGKDTTDVLYTFNCTKLPNGGSITGTLEFKSSTTATTDTYEIINMITMKDASGDSRSSDDDTTNTVTTAAGAVTLLSISKTFDDKSTSGTDSYEAKGTATDTFTPDTPGSRAGDVSIASSVTFTKNGTAAGTYTVASTSLHRSATCGFDSGSIEFKNATDDVVITFNGCQKAPTITDNGKAVTHP